MSESNYSFQEIIPNWNYTIIVYQAPGQRAFSIDGIQNLSLGESEFLCRITKKKKKFVTGENQNIVIQSTNKKEISLLK